MAIITQGIKHVTTNGHLGAHFVHGGKLETD